VQAEVMVMRAGRTHRTLTVLRGLQDSQGKTPVAAGSSQPLYFQLCLWPDWVKTFPHLLRPGCLPLPCGSGQYSWSASGTGEVTQPKKRQ